MQKATLRRRMGKKAMRKTKTTKGSTDGMHPWHRQSLAKNIPKMGANRPIAGVAEERWWTNCCRAKRRPKGNWRDDWMCPPLNPIWISLVPNSRGAQIYSKWFKCKLTGQWWQIQHGKTSTSQSAAGNWRATSISWLATAGVASFNFANWQLILAKNARRWRLLMETCMLEHFKKWEYYWLRCDIPKFTDSQQIAWKAAERKQCCQNGQHFQFVGLFQREQPKLIHRFSIQQLIFLQQQLLNWPES